MISTHEWVEAAPAYYNENDPFASQWLQNLSAGEHVAPGVVDARSIREVAPVDLGTFRQCHFFAGIGVWSYALRLAGWPDTEPVWTGSCPCQPFSVAGNKRGTADDRHLWPEWFRLIRECRPSTIFGEQVASVDGLAWFDSVSTDLERAGYSVAAADLCAASVGAPHVRQRLFFLAHTNNTRLEGWRSPERAGSEAQGQFGSRVPPHDPWGGAEWIPCRDGKLRATQPGIRPLVDGAAARMGRLRAYGNAIASEVAATFIRAAMEVI